MAESRQPDPGNEPTITYPANVSYRYEILSELGRGGMGVVYKARDRETNTIIAVKLLHPEIASRVDLIERFKSELVLARKITHKNVCRVYDLNRFENVVAISMEYVEGESLRTLLQSVDGLSVRHGLKIVRQVIAGLVEAHAQGVVHRDLKPENILIARDGTVKVMDFGIARSVESTTTVTTAIVGTPAYMSPEQAEGKPVDARSDIYSLGLVMYEMFCGGRAFTGDTPMAVAIKQIQETPPDPIEVEPHLPDFLNRIILKCIEKNPSKRFQTAADVAAALATPQGFFEAQRAFADDRLTVPVELKRWQRSDWVLTLLAMAGLAIFFPMFYKSSFAPRSPISFDRSVLRRLAQEYAQRLGAPSGQQGEIAVRSRTGRYEYVATHTGAEAALDLTSNPIPYVLFNVEWANGTSIDVDNHGTLQSFSRDFPQNSEVAAVSASDAKTSAENAIREYFGADPAALRFETAGDEIWRNRPAKVFTWTDPKDYSGLTHRLVVRVVGKDIASLDSNYFLPKSFESSDVGWQMLGVGGFDLVLLIIGFTQWQLVNVRSRWRIVLIAMASLMGALSTPFLMSQSSSPAKILVSIMLAISTAFLAFFVLVPVETTIRKMWPAKLSSFISIFDGRVLSEPCGIGVLRGTLAGLFLLGFDAFLVWAGTNFAGMWLEHLPLILMPSPKLIYYNPWPAVMLAVFQALVTTILVAFLTSLTAGLVRSRLAALSISAALAAVIFPGPVFSMGAVEPFGMKLIVLWLDFVILGVVFMRFDVLTLMVSALTLAFVADNYALYVTFKPSGSVEEILAFAVWALFVASAAAVAFKSSLRAAWRRVAMAFQ